MNKLRANNLRMLNVLTLVLNGLKNGNVKSKPILEFGNKNAKSLDLLSLEEIVEDAIKKASK